MSKADDQMFPTILRQPCVKNHVLAKCFRHSKWDDGRLPSLPTENVCARLLLKLKIRGQGNIMVLPLTKETRTRMHCSFHQCPVVDHVSSGCGISTVPACQLHAGSPDWATRATRVEGRINKIGDRHICRVVPRVAQPDVHTGLGGHPVLIETTSPALLLTVEGDGEGVAHEYDADPGDLTNWQGVLGITSKRRHINILAARLRGESR